MWRTRTILGGGGGVPPVTLRVNGEEIVHFLVNIVFFLFLPLQHRVQNNSTICQICKISKLQIY